MRKRLQRLLSLLLCMLMILTNNVFAFTPKETQTENDSTMLITTDETTWSYLEDNTDPATGSNAGRLVWTQQDYDDSKWSVGRGSFGAKKGKIDDLGNGCIPDILLEHYIDGVSAPTIPAYFFRAAFEVEDVDKLEALEAKILYDDAVIIYINGTEVYRGNTPMGGYNKNLEYGALNGNSAPNSDTFIIKDLSSLVDGTNTIAVELHQDRASSSDIYFDFCSLQPVSALKEEAIKAVALTVGADQTQTNITWYSTSNEAGVVQLAKKSQTIEEEFPAESTQFVAEIEMSNDQGYYSNQAVITDLEENTEYLYRVGHEDHWSETYELTSKSFSQGFSFLLAGDPQIGSGSINADVKGWNNSLENAIQAFPSTSFIISAGDQVNTASNEKEYAGYLSPKELTSYPVAANIGNHDVKSNSYSQHFKLPNVTTKLGGTSATGRYGGDYWYTYNNTLFMSLNSNNLSTAQHRQFMTDVLKEQKDGFLWTVVTFHHSIYSTASHESDSDIIQRRSELSPVFSDLGIDVVLMGHDHVYTRSYMMDGTTPNVPEDGLIPASVTDPDEREVLYITANSASGSKFYEIHNKEFPYSAVKNQENVPNISNIEVTDNSFRITTYRSTDMTVVDRFTINKTTIPDQKPAVKGIEVKKQPTKQIYEIGDKFDTTGIEVAVNYSDNTNKIVEDIQLTGFDSTVAGIKTITVVYYEDMGSEIKEFRTEFQIVVKEIMDSAEKTEKNVRILANSLQDIVTSNIALDVKESAAADTVESLRRFALKETDITDSLLWDLQKIEVILADVLGIRTVILADDIFPNVNITGAAFSAPLDSIQSVKPVISIKKTEIPIGQPGRITNAIAFNIQLDTISTDSSKNQINIQPKVPLTITMDIPSGIDADRLVMIQYRNNQSEIIYPKINGNRTTITLSSLSTYVIGNQTSNNSNVNNSSSDSSEKNTSLEGNWIKDSTGWWYLNNNGGYPKKEWKMIQNSWYYFNNSGYMQTGWLLDDSKWYYLEELGNLLANSWLLYNTNWYYFDQNGVMRTEDFTYKGKSYEFNEHGSCVNP